MNDPTAADRFCGTCRCVVSDDHACGPCARYTPSKWNPTGGDPMPCLCGHPKSEHAASPPLPSPWGSDKWGEGDG